MSRSPSNKFHPKIQDDVRKLLEKIYLKKTGNGRNSENMSSQVMNSISEVFDGNQQQIKQKQIQKLKERLDTLCSSQPNQFSPTQINQSLQYQMDENQSIKLPKLFKYREYGSLSTSKQPYQQYNQFSSRIYAHKQSSQSPEPYLNQKENQLGAYCNDFINQSSTGKHQHLNYSQDRSYSYDIHQQQNTTTSRRNSKPIDSYKMLSCSNQGVEQIKILPKYISQQNCTPVRQNIHKIDPQNKYKHTDPFHEKPTQYQLCNNNKQQQQYQYQLKTNDQDVREENNVRFNKGVFLSQQKEVNPQMIKEKKGYNQYSEIKINESKEIQQQQPNNKINSNTNAPACNSLTQQHYPHESIPFRNNQKQRVKANDFIQSKNTQDNKSSKIGNGGNYKQFIEQKRSQSQQTSCINDSNKGINNLMLISDESPLKSQHNIPQMMIPQRDNSFIRDVVSTQKYLKENNNDVWTLISKFNIQKEIDQSRKAQQQFQDQAMSIKFSLDNQVQYKTNQAKNQFLIDQQYSQISKKQNEKQTELSQNQKYDDLQKKRQQLNYLDDQIIQKQEQKIRDKKQLDQDHQAYLLSIKYQEFEEEQKKQNQANKQKQLYEGIKQDYIQKHSKSNVKDLYEDQKLSQEKKRIISFVKELDNSIQNSSNVSQNQYPNEKLIQREKIKPIDKDILKEWANMIEEKNKQFQNNKYEDKRMQESQLQQIEIEEEQELRKQIEQKVKIALNNEQIKQQFKKKTNTKLPIASDTEILNNLSVLKEIDEYIKNSQINEQ